MWNKDEVKGKAEEVKGKAKQAVGDVTDDEDLQAEGEAQEAGGKVQGGFGKARGAKSATPSRTSATPIQALEQCDVNRGSRFDGVHVGGNLDISVGARHARDVAGCLECRHGGRHSRSSPYRTDAGPAAEATRCASGSVSVLLTLRTQARDPAQHRDEQHVRVRQARRRDSPACANTGLPLTMPSPVGLPGFTATP